MDTDRATTDGRPPTGAADAPPETTEPSHDTVSERPSGGTVTDAGMDEGSTRERGRAVTGGVDSSKDQAQAAVTTGDGRGERTAGSVGQRRSDGGSSDDESLGRQLRSLLWF